MEREEIALRVVGLPIVLRIDADVWRAWGQKGPIECVLERLEDEGEGGEGWLTLKECAAMLVKDLNWNQKNKLHHQRAYMRIINELRSQDRKIKDNGKEGRSRRIDRTTFDSWRLKQRDLAAKRDGWDVEGDE